MKLFEVFEAAGIVDLLNHWQRSWVRFGSSLTIIMWDYFLDGSGAAFGADRSNCWRLLNFRVDQFMYCALILFLYDLFLNYAWSYSIISEFYRAEEFERGQLLGSLYPRILYDMKVKFDTNLKLELHHDDRFQKIELVKCNWWPRGCALLLRVDHCQLSCVTRHLDERLCSREGSGVGWKYSVQL